MSAIRGFITNLGKYNEGELIGEWIDFPISDEDLQAVLSRIGTGEYFFTDWELPEGMDWQIFGEYANIEDVNKVADYLEQENDDPAVLSAIFEHASDIDEAIEILKSGNFMIYWGADDTRALGEIAVDEFGGISNLSEDTLEEYFDYEAYGRSLETGSTIVYFDGGAIEIFR